MSGPYPHLLSPGRIGALALRNRIALTPMGTNLENEDGTPGERISRFYEERARGGVGMIVVGVTGVAWPAGVSNPRNMGLSRDEFVAPFRALTGRVHDCGAAIAVQLQHAGKTSLEDVAAGRPVWVPSALPDAPGDLFDALAPEEVARVTEPFVRAGGKVVQHELSEADIDALCGLYADAAERARAAGFDGAEIHAGHGYLIAAFLSGASNRRQDAYGGPLENRARLLLRVIAAVRERVGPGFPLWCRLDGAEYGKPGGISEEDARQTAAWAVAAGLDAIHVSAHADSRSAIAFTTAPLPHEPAAYLGLARGIKQRVDAPVIAVGRLVPDTAERALAAGDCDFVAMGRALIADPELPRKLARGDDGVRRCIYSYRCVGNIFLRESARCAVNPRAGREIEAPLRPADAPRRVLVAGGGPAGLEAARLLALRGHSVALWEREPVLGGLARAAGHANPDNAPLLEGLARAAESAKVELRLGAEVTARAVAGLDPDVVVVAVGAAPARPALPGADADFALDLWQLRDGLEPALARGPRVAVLGGGLIGAEIAEWLSARDARVTLVASTDQLALDMSPPRRWRARHALRTRGVACFAGATAVAIEPGALRFRDAGGAEHTAQVDAVVLSEAAAPNPALFEALAGGRAELHRIGDCVAPRTFEEAFAEASDLALRL